jgi:uncharacterized GH25 family protein
VKLDAEHGNDRRAWVGLLAPLAAGAVPRGTVAPAPAPASAPAPAHGHAGGLIASTPAKVLLAILVVGLIVVVSRVAGIWGGGDTKSTAPVASTTRPSSTAADPVVKVTTPSATARALPTIRDDDPRGTLRLEGQVIDEQNAPVAHAMVAIDANPAIVVETESDGGFVFEGLIPRDYRIEATLDDRYAGPARLRLSEKAEPLTLRMARGGTVEVTVTERANGAPLAGAEVELRSWLSTLTWKATTDAKGIAKLTGVGAGWSPLVVRAKGFAQSGMMLGTSGNPDNIEHATLSLARGAALVGRVVDEKGKPVANARVVATSASNPEPLDFVDPDRDAVITSADGRFSIATLSAGTWRLTASAGDYAPTTSAPVSLDGVHARDDFELKLATGAVVRGSVIDTTGAPVRAANVSVVVESHLPWRARRQAFTDANGRFSIGGLAPRAVDVVAWHDSGASAIIHADLATQRESDIVLKLDVTGTIAGVVVDEHGKPIGDAQVMVVREGTSDSADRAAWAVRGAQEAITDQSGAFRFAGLPDGLYRVGAVRPAATQVALSPRDRRRDEGERRAGQDRRGS